MQADATTSHTALIGSPRAMATKPSAPAPRAATSNQNIFLAKFMCPARLCESCYLAHILCAHCRTVNTPPQPQAAAVLILADFVRDAWLGVPEGRHPTARHACSERSDAGAAGFGGASVPLAICASPSRRKTAGGTPAPPHALPEQNWNESRVRTTSLVRNPG